MIDHDELDVLSSLSGTLVNVIYAVDSDLKCKKCMYLLLAKEILVKSLEILNQYDESQKRNKAWLIYVERKENYLYR
jgi:hypothetical protein